MDFIKPAIEATIGLLGILGNAVLLFALMRVKTGWNRFSLQLVAPIAILDLAVASLILLKSILSLVIGNDELMGSGWFCKYVGSTATIMVCVCIVLISAVATARYAHVVYSRPIKCKHGWPVVVTISLVICGIIGSAIAIDGLVPDSTMSFCQLRGPGLLFRAAYLVSSFVILCGLVIVTFCYVGIYVRCRSTLNVLPGRFLLILLAYHFCWMPKFVQIFWELYQKRDAVPWMMRILAYFSISLLHFVSPCLMIGFQASLRKELTALLYQKPSPVDDTELESHFLSRYQYKTQP